ncbi:MAG: hypothetical protein H6707_01005 [Deltaproteobacteria bacterium]|nr:hypothetical protein [Deltaproteobacteria bacterium]
MSNTRCGLAATLISALFTACSGNAEQPTDAGASDAVQALFVQAQLADYKQRPIQRAGAIVCNETVCYSGESGITGGLTIAVAMTGRYLFHMRNAVAYGEAFADVAFGVTIDDLALGSLDLGVISPAPLGAATRLDPSNGGKLTLDGGVILDVAPGVTIPAPLMTDIDVAAAVIPAAQIPQRLLATGPARTALLGWVLTPWEVTFSSPVDFLIPSTAQAIAEADLYHADFVSGALKPHGKVKVDASGAIKNLGPGLSALGWFVVYAPAK